MERSSVAAALVQVAQAEPEVAKTRDEGGANEDEEKALLRN